MRDTMRDTMEDEMDRFDAAKKAWEEPKLVVHGDVERITQTDKDWGSTDGFTFQGIPIRDAS
jgi:hypothetical protein